MLVSGRTYDTKRKHLKSEKEKTSAYISEYTYIRYIYANFKKNKAPTVFHMEASANCAHFTQFLFKREKLVFEEQNEELASCFGENCHQEEQE